MNWTFRTTSQRGRVSLDTPLLKFELFGHKVQQSRFSQLPYSPFLTSIKMEMAQTITLDMNVLSRARPLLEHFHAGVKEQWALFLPGPWIPTPEGADTARPQYTLPLRSLVLLKANFQQPSLHALLSRTPNIEEHILGHLARDNGICHRGTNNHVLRLV